MPKGSSRYILHNAAVTDAVTSKITSAVSVIEDRLNELEHVSSGLRELWSGEAAQAYDDAHRRWDRSLREMSAIAKALTSVAERGSTRMTAFDQAQTKVWQF